MNNLTSQEIKQIAEEAYIYAYPMLDNYKMMFAMAIYQDSPAYEKPFNEFINVSVLHGPDYTAIVRPNSDTFYSGIWLDLRAEPIVLQVPAVQPPRYYAFQLIDFYTHNFDYIGSRTTGFEAGDYLIAGPDWEGEKPEKVTKIIRCETNFMIALARTQVYGADDVDNVKAIQAQYRATPLSACLGTEAPPAPAALIFPIWNPEQVYSAGFIGYLNFLLEQLKPHPSEADLFERFAGIGIGPSLDFDPGKVDPETLAAIEAGVASAAEKIERAKKELGERKDGWMLISGAFGTREMMAGKYLTRAAAAAFGLWGNNLEEAFYPECSMDADGDALDASKHNYVLHFEADQIPPIKAFWSLSMYKLPEQLFIHNPLNRYVISSITEGLRYGEDGSLTIYLQNESPGPELESNWLPAPDGPFSLQARLYWPEPEALEPLYAPPPVRKL